MGTDVLVVSGALGVDELTEKIKAGQLSSNGHCNCGEAVQEELTDGLTFDLKPQQAEAV
jgi:hypothetical protein